MGMNVQLHGKDSSGAAEAIRTTGKSQHVTNSAPQSTSHNRNIAAADITYAAATNSCTWTAAENVTWISVTPMAAAAATPDAMEEYILVMFDAYDAGAAAALLADAGGAGQDVAYSVIPFGETRTFSFPSYVSRMDVVSTVDNTRIFVEAR